MTRVLLLCGGQSEEHRVSLASARSVVAAAGPELELTPLVVSRTGRLLSPQASLQALSDGHSSDLEAGTDLVDVKAQRFDVVFPLLHGPFGEDGTVQGLLKFMGLPFVGSDVLGSAVGMDKLMMKAVFSAHALPQVPYTPVQRARWQQTPEGVLAALRTLRYPLFVKPANLGSSVGITKVATADALPAALNEAARFDRRIIVEEGLEGARELEVAVLGNEAPEASPVGEIVFDSDFYDYHAKYTEGEAELRIPAAIPAEVSSRCQALALEAFAATDAAGLARIDFFYKDDELFLNEINTMPGFTTTSMYPKLWEAAGLSYAELVKRLVQLALEPR